MADADAGTYDQGALALTLVVIGVGDVGLLCVWW